MKKRGGGILWKIFLLCYTLILAAVLVLCVMETQDGIPAYAMALRPVAGLLLVLALAVAGGRAERFLERHERWMLPLFFLLYTLVLLRLTLHSRGIPYNDQAALIQGAKYLAGQGEEMNWNYFARWNHNIMPMLLLSYIFRAADWLHMMDGYYLVLGLNCLQVLVALYCVYRLGRRYSRHSIAAAWAGMLMAAVFLPVMGHTQAVYTDAFSYSFGIVAFSVWLCGHERRKAGKKSWPLLALAGVIWAVGFEIKATVIISLMAVLIYLALFDGWKGFLRNAAALLPPLAVVAVACSIYIQTLPSAEFQDTWGVPQVGYFIGVGLEGNGGYDAESEYYSGVTGIAGMENKKAFSRQFILGHLDRFLDSDHMVAKLRHNFATGVMRADDFLIEAENNGFLYNCISYGGYYRDTYRTWVTAYWYMLLWWIVIACVLLGLRRKIGQAESPEVFVPLVSVCGIMLYVMVFEANNRQLYNHIPMIFCAANMGIWLLHQEVEAKIGKLLGKGGKGSAERDVRLVLK